MSVVDGWLYKRPHVITNSSDSELTDYQVKFTVFVNSSGTSSGDMICIETGKAKTDFSDIRFCDEYLTTKYSYWIEEISGYTAYIWVKIPSIPTTGITINVVYGKSDAISESSGLNTFIFFDDFETNNSAQYTTYNLSRIADPLSVRSGTIGKGSAQTMMSKTSGITHTGGYAVECNAMRTSNSSEWYLVYNGKYLLNMGNSGSWKYYTGSSYSSLSLYSTNTWYKVSVRCVVSPTTKYYVYVNNSNISGVGITNNSQFNSAPSLTQIITSTDASNYTDCHIDNYFIRKFSDTEPVHSTWGTEQLVEATTLSIVCTPSSGYTPLTINVNVYIKEELSDFKLIFGDGDSYNASSQTSFSTSHTYNDFGTFNLYAEGFIDNTIYTSFATITVTKPIVTAAFTPNQTNNTIHFTDLSTGSPDEWYWVFGDGTNSNEQNPTHVYNTPGTYTVTLYASNQQNESIASSTITINEPTPSVTIEAFPYDDYVTPAKFSFTYTETINETLNEEIVSVLWNIDGTSYTDDVPIVTFLDAGTKSITCTIENNYGNTAFASTSITLDQKPVANFKPSKTNIVFVPPLQVQFTNLSTPSTCTYLWNFGDGSTSTDQHPTHSFATYGNYDVALTAINSVGQSTITYSDVVQIKHRVKYLHDSVIVSDSGTPIKTKTLLDTITTSTLCCSAKLLHDIITSIQDQIPTSPGIEEDSSRTIRTTIDEWGHAVFRTITDTATRVIKIAGYDNKTGFSIMRVKELEEMIVVEEEIDR